MERPTKETVDAALAVCDRERLSASSYPVILADEVRALREELAQARGIYETSHNSRMHAEDVVRRHEATIARVEALAKYWRQTSGYRTRAYECAEDLETTLKGGA
jgi:hypothetical protein